MNPGHVWLILNRRRRLHFKQGCELTHKAIIECEFAFSDLIEDQRSYDGYDILRGQGQSNY